MIVLVARNDVECHTAKLLFHRLLAEIQSLDHAERLLVGVGAGLIEVVVCHRAERQEVNLVAGGGSVEASGHEMIAPVFGQDSAFGHGDARGSSHQVVGVLDQSVPLRIIELAVTVAGHAVELQQPAGKPVAGGDLPGAHLAGSGVPGDDRLGAGAAGRSAHPEDALQCLLPPRRFEGAGELLSPGKYLAGQLDECGHLHR